MPARQGLRPLKAWRYIAVFSQEMMLCLGAVRVGPARQAFWAIWDRGQGRLRQRTVTGRGNLLLETARARVLERDVQLDLRLAESDGVEAICPSGRSYAWTRKQGGVEACGTLILDGETRTVDGLAVIDDTRGFYQRHTAWQWSAGVGRGESGEALAWNLVSGVNDPAQGSERTIWIDGKAREVPPVRFQPDLRGVEGLHFKAEVTRAHRENLLLLRSRYRQPFGTFSGELPGGPRLTDGLGVMEEHEVWW